jgi:hypothetical protein
MPLKILSSLFFVRSAVVVDARHVSIIRGVMSSRNSSPKTGTRMQWTLRR